MSEQEKYRDLSVFEQENQIEFADRELLFTAFVHSSYLNEAVDQDNISDNERLEFLGDVVLGFVVSEMLYTRFEELREGGLTSVRAALVRREALARFARIRKLGDYLLLGRGEEESGGRKRLATLCATFEAVVGAIYLDQGLDAVRRFVLPLANEQLEQVLEHALNKDAKSRLQEWSQAAYGKAPRYHVLAEDGPDHAKVFTSEVAIDHIRCGVGRGRSKQDASQAAAAMALYVLGHPAPEYEAEEDIERDWPVDDNSLDGLNPRT